MNSILSKLMTETDVSQLLVVSKAALRRWRRENRGPAFVRVERVIRYEPEAIREFLTKSSGSTLPDSLQESFQKKNAADSRSAARKAVRHGHATTHRT